MCLSLVDHIRLYSLQTIGVDVCKGLCMAGLQQQVLIELNC